MRNELVTNWVVIGWSNLGQQLAADPPSQGSAIHLDQQDTVIEMLDGVGGVWQILAPTSL